MTTVGSAVRNKPKHSPGQEFLIPAYLQALRRLQGRASPHDFLPASRDACGPSTCDGFVPLTGRWLQGHCSVWDIRSSSCDYILRECGLRLPGRVRSCGAPGDSSIIMPLRFGCCY